MLRLYILSDSSLQRYKRRCRVFARLLAMSRKSKRVEDLGVVDLREGRHRAHVQYRNDTGEKCNIYGPWRDDSQRAQGDLKKLRSAGNAAECATRADAEVEAASPQAAMVRAAAELKSKAQPWPMSLTEAFLKEAERKQNVETFVFFSSFFVAGARIAVKSKS